MKIKAKIEIRKECQSGGVPLTHAQELAKYGQIVFVSNVNIQWSTVVGDAVETGIVSTDKGWSQGYKTYYKYVVGLPAVTASIQFIFPHNATFSDWAGSYSGESIGLGYFSFEHGSSSSYDVFGIGLGPSWGPHQFKGISGGGQIGTTTLVGQPYYKPYPYGSGPFSNSYFSEMYGN